MSHINAGSRLGALTLAFLLSFGTLLSVAPLPHASAQETTATGAPAEDQPAVQIVQDVSSAVVTVLNITTGPSLMGQAEALPQGVGTGFIIDQEGHIVTNWHVVEGGDSFGVILMDGTQLDAELIGIDPRNDLAVVKIAPGSVPAVVSMGDSEDVLPGESVLAIGSPLGAFSNTVTAGIVSGTGRNQLENPQSSVCQDYSNLIQHDAAINPGNSGGPLFNMSGEVIGVNTLGIPSDAAGQPVQGIFFAVPSNTVKITVDQLIETGEITRPFVGITYFNITPQAAAQYDLPVDAGAIVTEVAADSPAGEAGLQANDIITAVDGQELTTDVTFEEILLEYQPGDQVTFTVIRGEDTSDFQLTLGEATVDFSQCALPVQQP